MRVAVIGLGHLGSVTAACLAKAGHRIAGFDTDGRRLAALLRGRAPVRERGLDALTRAQVRAGRLRAAARLEEAVDGAEIMLVCVGTPAARRGGLDTSAVERCCAQLARLLRPGQRLAVRSTLPLGATTARLAPLLGAAAHRALFLNPDFGREGHAVADFLDGTRVVVGSRDGRAPAALRRLYSFRGVPLHAFDWTTAELVKLSDNAFHALKVAFANEIGALGRLAGADAHAAMASLASDERLNASRAYLRPGEPFGGPCLEKDLRALARAGGPAVPLLSAVLRSNERRLEETARALLERGRKRFLLGPEGFKPGVSDERGRALEALARRLQELGGLVRRTAVSAPPAKGEMTLRHACLRAAQRPVGPPR